MLSYKSLDYNIDRLYSATKDEKSFPNYQMAYINSRGRRPALIPDSVILSPEEAEDVSRRRAGDNLPHRDIDGQPPRLEDPFKQSQIGTPEEIHNKPQVNNEQFFNHKINCQSGDLVWHSDDLHGKRVLQAAPGSPSRNKFRRLSGQNTLLHHPVHLRLESKSSDGCYAETERLRYSTDIFENIPHMSEVPSETKFRRSGFMNPILPEAYTIDPSVCIFNIFSISFF